MTNNEQRNWGISKQIGALSANINRIPIGYQVLILEEQILDNKSMDRYFTRCASSRNDCFYHQCFSISKTTGNE